MSFSNGPPSCHLFQFQNPDAVLVSLFTQPCFSLAHKIDGTTEIALHFHIIVQYMVKTKFDDVLKILVAQEKTLIHVGDIYYPVFLQC